MRAPSPETVEKQRQQADLPPLMSDKNLPANIEPGHGHIEHRPREPVLPQTGFANIATAISAIMSEIGVVGEGGENKFQNYKYMSYKDMYRKLTPLMGKHGLAVIPTEKTRSLFDNDAVISATYSFTIIHKAGEVWPYHPEWTGVSRARDSKGGLDDKALNKCATAAQKYFLKALFQIPSGEEDEDPDHNDGSVPRETKVRAPSPPKAEPVNPFRAKGKDVESWTDDLISLIKAAKSSGDLNAIDQENAEALERLSVREPKAYRKAYDAFVARKKELKPDPISSGPDPRAFVNAVIDNLDSFKDYPEMEKYWNEQVAPRLDGMWPADKDDLASAWRRNENRLAP